LLQSNKRPSTQSKTGRAGRRHAACTRIGQSRWRPGEASWCVVSIAPPLVAFPSIDPRHAVACARGRGGLEVESSRVESSPTRRVVACSRPARPRVGGRGQRRRRRPPRHPLGRVLLLLGSWLALVAGTVGSPSSVKIPVVACVPGRILYYIIRTYLPNQTIKSCWTAARYTPSMHSLACVDQHARRCVVKDRAS
jgi:hypothetical protein